MKLMRSRAWLAIILFFVALIFKTNRVIEKTLVILTREHIKASALMKATLN